MASPLRAVPDQQGTAVQRSGLLRTRVSDAIDSLSFGDREYGKQRFVARAIDVGRAAGLRLWNDNTTTMEKTALGSLNTLLGERTRAQGRTGVNEHWVLDLWELAVHEVFRGPVRIERWPRLHEDDPGEDDVGDKVGVKWVADGEKPLPMRVLDAYFSRDDEAMWELVQELERRLG